MKYYILVTLYIYIYIYIYIYSIYIYTLYIVYNIASSESIFISVIFGFSVSAPLKASMNVQRLASAGGLTVMSVWSIGLLTGNHSVKMF